MKRILLVLGFLAIVAAVVVAYVKSPTLSPKEACERFVAALQRGDIGAALEFVDSEAAAKEHSPERLAEVASGTNNPAGCSWFESHR